MKRTVKHPLATSRRLWITLAAGSLVLGSSLLPAPQKPAFLDSAPEASSSAATIERPAPNQLAIDTSSELRVAAEQSFGTVRPVSHIQPVAASNAIAPPPIDPRWDAVADIILSDHGTLDLSPEGEVATSDNWQSGVDVRLDDIPSVDVRLGDSDSFSTATPQEQTTTKIDWDAVESVNVVDTQLSQPVATALEQPDFEFGSMDVNLADTPASNEDPWSSALDLNLADNLPATTPALTIDPTAVESVAEESTSPEPVAMGSALETAIDIVTNPVEQPLEAPEETTEQPLATGGSDKPTMPAEQLATQEPVPRDAPLPAALAPVAIANDTSTDESAADVPADEQLPRTADVPIAQQSLEPSAAEEIVAEVAEATPAASDEPANLPTETLAEVDKAGFADQPNAEVQPLIAADANSRLTEVPQITVYQTPASPDPAPLLPAEPVVNTETREQNPPIESRLPEALIARQPGLSVVTDPSEPAELPAPSVESMIGPGDATTPELIDNDEWTEPFGMGADCGMGCPRTAYVNVEGLYLFRESSRGRTLSANDPFGLQRMGYTPGVRVTAGLVADCLEGTEFGFTGGFVWEEQALRTGAGTLNPTFTGLGVDISGFTGANAHFQRHRSDMLSAEWNRKCWGWDVISTYYGLRYLYFNDDYRLDSLTAGGGGSLDIDVNNHLVGPQIGMDLFAPVGRLSTTTRMRGGVFANFDDTRINLVNNGTTQFDNIDESVDLSFLAELAFLLHFQVTPHLKIHGGYEFTWIYGLALSTKQLDNPLTTGTGRGLEGDSDLWLHGATVGAELAW